MFRGVWNLFKLLCVAFAILIALLMVIVASAAE